MTVTFWVDLHGKKVACDYYFGICNECTDVTFQILPVADKQMLSAVQQMQMMPLAVVFIRQNDRTSYLLP